MSVLFYPESIRILGSDANGNNVMLCEMAVDDIANLPAANAFISDGYVLSMGCVATAINDNSKHRLNSQGQWVQIEAGTSTYTRAEIDALLSVIDAENTSQQAEINYAINTGVKNLFPITASGTQTIGGVVFTVNSDGTITANGTKTNNDWLILSENNSFGAGTYTLSDGLPVDTTDCQLIITTERSMTAAIMATAANARPQTKTFTTEQTGLYYAIRIASGKTVNNLTFKPMIRPAAITDPTYEPYAPTNRQLYEMILQLQGG